MNKEYKPASGSRLTNEQAKKYGNQITKITERKGFITPKIVLDDARKSNSPLNDYFEWNNRIASEKWRLTQASYLIRSITITIMHEDKPQVRHFFSVRATDDMDTKEAKVYVTLDTIMNDEQKRREVVAYALRELRGWTERYSQYSELKHLREYISTEMEEMGAITSKS